MLKIPLKAWRGFRAALSRGAFNGIGFNDDWNMRTFGINRAQYAAIMGVCTDLLGMDYAAATFADVNRFLAGEKTCLARLHPDREKQVREAFPE